MFNLSVNFVLTVKVNYFLEATAIENEIGNLFSGIGSTYQYTVHTAALILAVWKSYSSYF